MEKRRKTINAQPKMREQVQTEEERVIKNLLANGAVEITPAMQKKEPYKSIIKKIKYDLIHEP
jgi:redox-regulated HSP33 family molecular chaperone